jgi:gluconokinase
MGVTGAGKTTIGTLLARQMGWQFMDADSFHPPANIEKMACGVPLTDRDREPWLAAIHSALLECAARNRDVVLACSALKQNYRETLASGLDLRICYIKGTYEEMKARLASRKGHFAGEAILAGQFSDLEEPLDALVLPLNQPPEEIVRYVIRQLKLAAL